MRIEKTTSEKDDIAKTRQKNGIRYPVHKIIRAPNKCLC